MSEKRLKKQLLKKKLFAKNRLVILNEDTFEEIFSLKLTLMNVFVFASLGAILIIFVTTFIIAFTPLREYIPGYTSTKLKKDATELALKSDSLEFAIKKNELYLESIKKVLNGNLQYAKVNKDSILAIKEDTLPDLQLTASESELKLRQQVADEEEKAKEAREKNKKKRK
jgi:hypothetical protein